MRQLLGTLMLLIGSLVLAVEPIPVVGLVWWPADSDDPRYTFGRETEACLASAIGTEAPLIRLVPHQTIRETLYPRLEPATQPPSEEAFAELLARTDVQDRLRRFGLTHLVAFTGGTTAPPFRGAILCGGGFGAGGCLGFAWQDKTTTLAAAVWNLERRERVVEEKELNKGTSIVPAFVLPLPLMADTHSAACHVLGRRIAHDLIGLPDSHGSMAPRR